jgi:hypothetical protein
MNGLVEMNDARSVPVGASRLLCACSAAPTPMQPTTSAVPNRLRHILNSRAALPPTMRAVRPTLAAATAATPAFMNSRRSVSPATFHLPLHTGDCPLPTAD